MQQNLAFAEKQESAAASNEIRYVIQMMTPDKAARMLDPSEEVEKATRRKANAYAREMRRGSWKINGDTVVVSSDGVVLDGKARLLACVECGIAFPTIVVSNVSPSAWITMNGQRRRSASDILTINGEAHPRLTATAFGLVASMITMKEAFRASVATVALPDISRLVVAFPEMEASIAVGIACKAHLPESLATALHFLASKADEEKADLFFAGVADEESDPAEPYSVLRQTYARILKEGGRIDRTYTMAIMVKAWNAFKEGVRVKQLRFSGNGDRLRDDNGTMTEAFPQVEGLPAITLPIAASVTEPAPADVAAAYRELAHSSEAEVSIVTMTPDMGRDLLSRNGPAGTERNRSLRKNHVETLAREMAAGRWAVNGKTVKVSRSGRLIDGQHRCSASVQSGIPFTTVLVRGLDDGVFTTFDTGSKLTFAAVLKKRGMVSTNIIQGALTALWEMETGETGPSNGELDEMLARHPGIQEGTQWANKLTGLMAPSQVAMLHYLFRQKDPELTEEFYQQIHKGANLSDTDGAYHLRERLLKERVTRRGLLSTREKTALFIKAWNAARTGTKVKNLSFRADEQFPVIA